MQKCVCGVYVGVVCTTLVHRSGQRVAQYYVWRLIPTHASTSELIHYFTTRRTTIIIIARESSERPYNKLLSLLSSSSADTFIIITTLMRALAAALATGSIATGEEREMGGRENVFVCARVCVVFACVCVRGVCVSVCLCVSAFASVSLS